MEASNIVNFGLVVVTAIAAVVSIIAVVGARRARQEAVNASEDAERAASRAATAAEGIESAMHSAADAQRRLRRSELARDLIVFFDRSTVQMVLGSELAVMDRDWTTAATDLNARARVIDSEGAVDLMQAAKRARAALDKLDVERRLEVAIRATQLLQLYAERWVEDGVAQTYPIEEWISVDDAILHDGA